MCDISSQTHIFLTAKIRGFELNVHKVDYFSPSFY